MSGYRSEKKGFIVILRRHIVAITDSGNDVLLERNGYRFAFRVGPNGDSTIFLDTQAITVADQGFVRITSTGSSSFDFDILGRAIHDPIFAISDVGGASVPVFELLRFPEGSAE